MYYFRDCYFDKQVAFGVAHASLARPPKRRTASRRSQGSVLDLVLPFVSIGVTFYLGLLVLDVLGLEHLVQAPSFEIAAVYLEGARSALLDVASKIPDLWMG